MPEIYLEKERIRIWVNELKLSVQLSATLLVVDMKIMSKRVYRMAHTCRVIGMLDRILDAAHLFL